MNGFCKYNLGVFCCDCDFHPERCEKCGFNPEVSEKRKQKIMGGGNADNRRQEKTSPDGG